MDKSILEVVHESVKDMRDAGVVDKQTMRKFDALCLSKVAEYTSAQIKKIRLQNNVSQAVFAIYLNTGVETVRKWEARGQTHKRPNGAAMKLLSIVEQYGIEILGESVTKPVQRILRKSGQAKAIAQVPPVTGLAGSFEMR